MIIRRLDGEYVQSGITTCDDDDFSCKIRELRGIEFGHVEISLSSVLFLYRDCLIIDDYQ